MDNEEIRATVESIRNLLGGISLGLRHKDDAIYLNQLANELREVADEALSLFGVSKDEADKVHHRAPPAVERILRGEGD